MYTEKNLITQLENMDIDPKGTIIVHSSMKSIGDVEGGADTVIDSFIEFMQDGLLVFPTHTWEFINEKNPEFYVDSTPTNIGILTELFRKRSEAIRSLHPTHSVAAIGNDAREFTEDNEKFDTPAARESSWGKLLDRQAKILLVGVDFTKNTFIHGIEEWMDIQGRLTEGYEALVTVLPNGSKISVPSRRHISPGSSKHYWKVENILADLGAVEYSKLGDTAVMVCDSEKLTRYISKMLEIDPLLFSDDKPLSKKFITDFKKIY